MIWISPLRGIKIHSPRINQTLGKLILNQIPIRMEWVEQDLICLTSLNLDWISKVLQDLLGMIIFMAVSSN